MSTLRNLISIVTSPFAAVVVFLSLLAGVFTRSGRDDADPDEPYGDLPGPIDSDHYR